MIKGDFLYCFNKSKKDDRNILTKKTIIRIYRAKLF